VLHDLATFDDAMEYLNEARDIFLAIGMVEEAAACDQNLGVILYDLGRYEEAGRRFAVARHRYDSVDAQRSAAECDSNLAALLHVMGHPDEAETYRRRAIERGVDAPLEPGLSGQVPVVPEAQPAGSFGNALA
jgi:tetratricopeptide (TPR) repeat protein